MWVASNLSWQVIMNRNLLIFFLFKTSQLFDTQQISFPRSYCNKLAAAIHYVILTFLVFFCFLNYFGWSTVYNSAIFTLTVCLHLIFILCAYMPVYHVHSEARRRHWICWNWSDGLLCGYWNSNLGPLEEQLTPNAPNWWATCPAPVYDLVWPTKSANV